MRLTLAKIAKIVDGEVVGDQSLVIKGLSGIQEARQGDLTFVTESKYFPLARHTQASAIIVSRDLDISGLSLSSIRVDNPSFAFAKIAAHFSDDQDYQIKGIHKTAVIAHDVKLGKNVAIGPCAVIEQAVKIGDHSIICAGCFVGHHAIMGHNCLIYPNVTIRERVTLENRVIIHSGTVIGSDGFGYIQVEGQHQKIPQIGSVVIEDDVEIGANVTIDRARVDKTIIGRGTKIDNLVQIAHNVILGENCILVSQVGISGSVTVGRGSTFGGQAGIAGHLHIGEGVTVTAKSGLAKSIPDSQIFAGYPARPFAENQRMNAMMHRLPKYIERIQALEKRIEELEKKKNVG